MNASIFGPLHRRIERVVHEVRRPHFVDPAWQRQRRRPVVHQSLARFDVQIQIQFPIDPLNPLVVPAQPLPAAPSQKT